MITLQCVQHFQVLVEELRQTAGLQSWPFRHVSTSSACDLKVTDLEDLSEEKRRRSSEVHCEENHLT